MKEKNTISYSNYLKYINNLHTFSKDLSNKNVKKLLNSMNNFQNKLNVLHITGTNGKGSVITYLKNIYTRAGFKVATFTSPYFDDPKKCITLNDKIISNEDFLKCFFTVVQISESQNITLTRFEIITVTALLFMSEKKVDLAIVEVGIGSPYDSTNVFKNKTTVFTKIDFDHENILGKDKYEVASTKSKLITKNSKVVIGENEDKITDIIAEYAIKSNCEIFNTLSYSYKIIPSNDLLNHFFVTNGKRNLTFQTKMLGKHQIQNAITAIATTDAVKNKFPVTDEDIINGINKSYIPLRCDIVNDLYLIDGAHNTSGIICLKNTLQTQFKHKKIITVFGVLADKKLEEMLDIVNSFSQKIIFTKPISKRAYEWYNKKDYFDDYKVALNKASELANKYGKEDYIIVVTGSLYLCHYAKQHLIKTI